MVLRKLFSSMICRYIFLKNFYNAFELIECVTLYYILWIANRKMFLRKLYQRVRVNFFNIFFLKKKLHRQINCYHIEKQYQIINKEKGERKKVSNSLKSLNILHFCSLRTFCILLECIVFNFSWSGWNVGFEHEYHYQTKVWK